MNQQITWSALKDFVRMEASLAESYPLSGSMRLVEDLHITGDDADEFMRRYFQRFGVDPIGYDFHRYFLMEGEGLIYSLFQRWVFCRPHSLERKEITLEMLYRCAESRVWSVL